MNFFLGILLIICAFIGVSLGGCEDGRRPNKTALDTWELKLMRQQLSR